MLTINPEVIFLEERQKNRNDITSVAEKEIDLLGRHIEILKTVQEHGPIGIIRLSQVTGQPQHMVRYSLRTLEQSGAIKPSPQGAVVTESVHETLGTLQSTMDSMITTMTEIKKKLK